MEIYIAIFLIIILVALLCLLAKRDREIEVKEHQKELSQHVIALQQILFGAYKNPDCISDALKKVMEMQKSENSFLISLSECKVREIYTGIERRRANIEKLYGQEVEEWAPNLIKILKAGNSVVADAQKLEHQFQQENEKLLKLFDIHCLQLVPIHMDHELVAVLGSMNMEQVWEDAQLLAGVEHDFAMALNNVHTYRMVQKMSMTDALTGLQNRGSYQTFLMSYPSGTSDTAGCIYIDVNGLHELNNHFGHIAGDKMLLSIAKVLKNVFCHDRVFRIGGDEFVIFCMKQSEEDLKAKIQNFEQQIEEKGYKTAVGFTWQKSAWNLDELVGHAEKMMYDNKRRYYESCKREEDDRLENKKIDQIMQEKRDADIFLSIISPYFMGVYVVNMSLDDTRIIYRPMYFNDLLIDADYKFSKAFHEYIDHFVSPLEQEAFHAFVDYRKLSQRLETEETIEYYYSKYDGTKLCLRICKSDDYHFDKQETFWIFEKFNRVVREEK